MHYAGEVLESPARRPPDSATKPEAVYAGLRSASSTIKSGKEARMRRTVPSFEQGWKVQLQVETWSSEGCAVQGEKPTTELRKTARTLTVPPTAILTVPLTEETLPSDPRRAQGFRSRW